MKQPGYIDEIIIEEFKESKDEYVSGERLSKKINITRAAVWKHIKELRKMGYVIESIPSRGYKLIEIPEDLSIPVIERNIDTQLIGRDIRIYDEVNSTNDIAMDLGAKGEEEGVVIIAETQLRGRGRLGRRWISPRGVNLYMSILLRPFLHPFQAPALTMMGAVSIVDAIARMTGLEAWIKWPNDIILEDKKVSGILTEMNAEEERINYIVLGIGINVNMRASDLPADIRMPATSLLECVNSRIDRNVLAGVLIESLDMNYNEIKTRGITPILEKWRSLCITLHKKIKVSLPGETITGIAEDLSPEGGLVLRTARGQKRIVYAGDVTIL